MAERLRQAGSLLLVTHARPDGDGLGSMAALARAARAAGKGAHLLVPDNIPPRYRFLFPDDKPAGDRQFTSLASQADLVVILDTSAFAQLDDLDEELRRRRGQLVVIDHHAIGDDLTDAAWIDSTAAATGVMLGELLEELGWPLDPQAAEALLAAITTDTGWLRFANTDARCLRQVARLIEAGARMDHLYHTLYQADRPERLALLSRALAGMELHCEKRLAVMKLRKSDFAETRAATMETENFVNQGLRIGSVEASVMLVENDDAIRVSLRSRDSVDVAEIARSLGGGGHRRAAGVRLDPPLDNVKQRIIHAVAHALGQL